MQPTFPYLLLSHLSAFVAAQTGLSFPYERWGDLERGISAAAPDFNFRSGEECARWLLSAPLTRHMNEVLASHLSVGETYFFREKQNLALFEEQILSGLIQQRRPSERRLRFWSAGCCTGEEAYTIAILLDRLIPDIKEWNITILATDFNPEFLRKAARGVYGDWSFRDAPGWLRERYFSRTPDGSSEIHPRIRKMVTFSYLNFADDVYPSLSNNTGAMDVIFCRNVLMYFTAQRIKQVTDNFHRALVDGGWLIVSPAEVSNKLFAAFAPVTFQGGVLYRKSTDAQPFMQADLTPEPVNPVSQGLADWGLNIAPPDAAALHPDVSAPVAETVPAQDAQADQSVPPSRMARDCANQGRLGEALTWCDKALSADKLNPVHHYLRATIMQELGRHDDAIQALMHTLYLDHDFVLAHFAQGNLHHARGRYRLARRHFDHALLLLRRHAPDDILPEADGLTAGRLAEIITGLLASMPWPSVAAA